MSRAKIYVLCAYIFCLIAGILGSVHQYLHEGASRPLSLIEVILHNLLLGFLGSLMLSIWILPLAYLVAKIIDKIKGPRAIKKNNSNNVEINDVQ
jgi:hypothetical protein